MTRTRLMLGSALLLAAVPALGADTAYDLERLWLDPSARGSLVLGTGEALAMGQARLAVAGGWERSPLVLTGKGLRGDGLFRTGHRIGDVVRDRWTLHVVGAVGILDRLELGFRLPVTVSQKGSDLSAQGIAPVRKSLAGTASVMLRYGFLHPSGEEGLSSALAVEGGFPLVRAQDVDGNPKPFLVPRLEVGHRSRRLLVAANVGAILRSRALALPAGEKLRHEVTGGVVVATVGAPLRYELSLRGAANANGLGPHAELLAGARLGLRYGELFALAGPGFFSAPGTPVVRAVVGLAVGTPEPERKAAPTAQVDPCAPGQAHTPEQCPALDDDGDGIANADDRCPTVPGVAAQQGCPEPEATAAAAEPATPAAAKIEGHRIEIREKVMFATGKAELQERSRALLDEVARLLAANPGVGKVRIEGHTDDRGSAALNRRLSRARAEAVRDHLVRRGIDAARLEAAGFGPDRPAAPNATEQGREANRRVEFVILDVEAR